MAGCCSGRLSAGASAGPRLEILIAFLDAAEAEAGGLDF